jgi:hypothetical protein
MLGAGERDAQSGRGAISPDRALDDGRRPSKRGLNRAKKARSAPPAVRVYSQSNFQSAAWRGGDDPHATARRDRLSHGQQERLRWEVAGENDNVGWALNTKLEPTK